MKKISKIVTKEQLLNSSKSLKSNRTPKNDEPNEKNLNLFEQSWNCLSLFHYIFGSPIVT